MTAIESEPEEPKVAPLRVLLSSYACRPDSGSESGIGWNWVTHLAEAGCTLDVLTAARNQAGIAGFLAEHRLEHVRFHYVPVPWLSPWENGARHYLLWQWQAFRLARTLLRQRRCDAVLHVSYGSVHLPTQLWRLGVPTVFGPVGGGQVTPAPLLSLFGAQQRSERLRTLITRHLPWNPVYRQSMRRMRVVLGANSDTVALARQAGSRDVRLMCDSGLREDYAADKPRRFEVGGRLRLLWVGRFLPRKGLTLAFNALQRSRSDIELTLVGDGLEPAELDRMLSARGISGRVHWSGARLTWLEVRDRFRDHDALFFTSLRDSFGSQLLEAMSQGLPIIALSMSGARDFLPPEGALKVEPGADASDTAARLAAALDHFASLPAAERTRMSEIVWHAAKAFSWQRRAGEMVHLLRQLTHPPDR